VTRSSSTPFLFSSSEQHYLYERLSHFVGPGPAAMYQDAHRLLAETTPYVSTTHLVFHLLREIESAVRYVLLPYDYSLTVTYNSSEASSPAVPEASPQIVSVEEQPEQKENHKQEIEAIARRYHLTSSLTKTWTTLALRSKTSSGFAELAHRDALAMPRPCDTSFNEAVQQFEVVLAEVMEAFERYSFHVFQLLDRILAKQQPGKRDVSLFINRVPPNRVTYAYFFSRLEHPLWLTLLQEKGVFAPPPMGVQEGRVYYDLWPQADYLKRMAVNASAHKQVLSLLLTAAETENPFVQRAIVDIATRLPASLAVHIAPRIQLWFDQPHPQAFVTPLLEAFLEHLVQGGEASAALDLLDTSLTKMGERDSLSERWEYEQLLLRSQPLLVGNHTLAFLRVLCRLLIREVYQHFVRFRIFDDEDTTVQQRAQEASTLWQRTIEASEHPSTLGMNAPLYLLVATIRQTAEQAIQAQTLTLLEVVSLFETQPGKIFRRLALYILSRFASRNPALVRTWLLKRPLFDDADMRHEYVLLAREGLSTLSQEEQKMLFQWIKEGPDPTLFQGYSPQGVQEVLTEEQVQRHLAQWQWRWLGHMGENVLPPTWQPYYEALVEMFGVYQAPSLEEGWAQRSWPDALSVETYKTMPLDQFIEELQASRTEQGSMLPATLTSLLTTLIADAPTRFADQADLFQGQSPEIVAAALGGFTQATRSQHPFDWSHLLSLCTWTIEQRFPYLEEEENTQQDHSSWAEASKEVAVLLGMILNQPGVSPSLTHQETIWSMLATLMNDTYGLAQKNPHRELPPAWSVVLSSTQGQTMLAVIEYARWVQEGRQTEHTHQEAEQEQWTLVHVPEVRLLLERLLVPGQDDAGVVHAVLGHLFPLLFHLDVQWAVQHQHAIFPHDEASRSSFNAAWESFVLQPPPSRDVFEILRGEYAVAIDLLQSDDERELSGETPDERLATHLAILVIQGVISVDLPDPLLVHFFQHASDELCHRMVSDMGRIFVNDKDRLTGEMVEWGQYFWEWRTAQVSVSSEPQQSSRELAAFGWWVFKDIFPVHWSVEHLARVLSRSKKLDMSSFVVHRLAALASQEPRLTIQCLSHLVQGETSSWGSVEWNEAVRTILVEALQQHDEVIQAQAEAVISVLMMQGYTQYRELVSDVSA